MKTPQRLTALALFAALILGAAPAGATQHLVRAGDDWSKLSGRVQPGDDIILMPGKHKGATFEKLIGAPGKPISIRPADVSRAVIIEADDVGIVIKQAKHLRIESIAVNGAKRSGISIEGTAESPAEDILLRSVFVVKTGDRGDKDAIRLTNVSGATIEKSRIEGWHRAGIHVTASRDVTIRGTEWVGTPLTPDLYGIAIDGRSSDVNIERAKFGPGTTIAVAIGIADSDAVPQPTTSAAGNPNAKELPALAANVTVERSFAERPKRFVAIGACRSVTVRANTVLSPGALWEVAAAPKGWCAPTNVTLLANLVTWEPGLMQAFSVSAPGAEPKGVAIETNLWWSPELPAAKSLLGEFVGTMKAPQVLDRDPKLDNYYKPRDEASKSFGTDAP